MLQLGTATPEQMGEMFDLRWSILRQPLGEPRGTEQDEFDDLHAYPETVHGIVSDDGIISDRRIIVATGRIHRDAENPSEAQVRYMATKAAYRGQGLGSRLLSYMEGIAQNTMDGLEAIRLNAREPAVSLYAKAGYTAVSDIIELRGLPHIRMHKALR